MWYVIQVRTGTEEDIVKKCRNEYRGEKIDRRVLQDCFIPYAEHKRKIDGKWRTVKKVLFPGYVFLDGGDAGALYMELKKVTGLTRLLSVGDAVVPLTEKEMGFIMRFGGTDHVVGMSEGIIEGSRVQVLSGPLEGMETMIKRVDRHKRKAWLEVEMLGEIREIQVGLEIAVKTL
ncbi:MAG: antiterminator LoaP [Clostridiales bacterium]|nr:antiterminator LoaP [Clostridiales bacterium]